MCDLCVTNGWLADTLCYIHSPVCDEAGEGGVIRRDSAARQGSANQHE